MKYIPVYIHLLLVFPKVVLSTLYLQLLQIRFKLNTNYTYGGFSTTCEAFTFNFWFV